MSRYLAVDLGASGGRVLEGRWDGRRLTVEVVHRFPNGPVKVGMHFHTDLPALWREVKAGLAKAASAGGPIGGVGVDTWAIDYGLLDERGELLGLPFHYRDGRTAGMMDRAFKIVPKGEIFSTTGIQFLPFNTIYQLYSAAQAGDGLLERARRLLMIPDLIHHWMTGEQVAEYTNVTTTQLLDARDRAWAVGLAERLGIPASILPPVVPPGTLLGGIRPEVAGELGLKDEVPVVAVGTHDTASAVAAVPDLDAASAYLSSGTWSLMGVENREPVINDLSLVLNFTNEGGLDGTYRLLKNIMGLWLVQECQRRWAESGERRSWAELAETAAAAAPFKALVDPDAAEFLSPGDMPAAIRSYCRRTGQPEPSTVGEVMRCCLESLALKYRMVLEDLERLSGRTLEAVRIVGGGSQNRLLNQWTADACGRPVTAGPVEATAIGNLVAQLQAKGELSGLGAARAVVADSVERTTYEPDDVSAWEEAYGRFKDMILA